MREISPCEIPCSLLPLWTRVGACVSAWGRGRPEHPRGRGRPSRGLRPVCSSELVSLPLEGPCSGWLLPVWGFLYLDGGHMPLGLTSLPSIVTHKGSILFSLTGDPVTKMERHFVPLCPVDPLS